MHILTYTLISADLKLKMYIEVYPEPKIVL